MSVPQESRSRQGASGGEPESYFEWSFGSVEVFQPLPASASFTLASVVGAMLVGMGGARWLTNEVDKRLLRAATVAAASAPAAPAAAQGMAAASPANVLTIAQRIPSTTQQAA
jgi:hypothetical protein